MSHLRQILFLALAITTALALEAGAEDMGARAHAAGDAFRHDVFSEDAMRETLEVNPDPPQTTLGPGQLEEEARKEIASGSEAGRLYRGIEANLEGWIAVDTEPERLKAADAAVSDPEAVMDPDLFSADGAALACTVDSFEDAPVLERSCDRVLSTAPTTCTRLPTVSVNVVQTFTCSDDACAPLAAQPTCSVTGSVCRHFHEGACLDGQEFTYVCNRALPLDVGLTPTSTRYSEPLITWETSCDAGYDASLCTATHETCEGGPATAFSNGVAVPLDCGAPVEHFECLSDKHGSSCAVFEGSDGCTRTGSTCLFTTDAGLCTTYEDTYSCGGETDPAVATCGSVNVCVEETCRAVPLNQNEDFGRAAAYVGLLNDMALNWRETARLVESGERCRWTCPPEGCGAEGGEPIRVCTPYSDVIEEGGELQFFSGAMNFCRAWVLDALDCCSDNGWANGVFGDCREHELSLLSATHAGRVVYTDTTCHQKLLVTCIIKARHYCVFGSKLARVFNTEVQRVQGLPFDCRPLTYEELESADLSQIDLSPVYEDMIAQATVPDPDKLSGALRANTKAILPAAREIYE